MTTFLSFQRESETRRTKGIYLKVIHYNSTKTVIHIHSEEFILSLPPLYLGL